MYVACSSILCVLYYMHERADERGFAIVD